MRICVPVLIVLCGCWSSLAGEPAAVDSSSNGMDFDYFANNWNVVGLKDYVHGSRITPDNEVLLSGKTPVQVRVGSRRAARQARCRRDGSPAAADRRSDGPPRRTPVSARATG